MSTALGATVRTELDELGSAPLGALLAVDECNALVAAFDDASRYRSTVDMARHRYGRGVYRYFAYPLPGVVDELRHRLYPLLLPVAREWADRLGREAPWPDDLDDWLARCHDGGQRRPTPLVLRYGAGDWNALHQDPYGDLVFPLQVVVGLDEPGRDYTGGELVLYEVRPRAQSRATVRPLPQGHGVVLTTRDRPAPSVRGWSAAPMRHGVSTVHSGHRHTLGIIFHDAT